MAETKVLIRDIELAEEYEKACDCQRPMTVAEDEKATRLHAECVEVANEILKEKQSPSAIWSALNRIASVKLRMSHNEFVNFPEYLDFEYSEDNSMYVVKSIVANDDETGFEVGKSYDVGINGYNLDYDYECLEVGMPVKVLTTVAEIQEHAKEYFN